MGKVWLACCEPNEVARLRSEIEEREGSARVLRVGDASALGMMADAFPSGEAAAAIFAHGANIDEVEGVVGELARRGAASEIIVFVEAADPGSVARLFFAGATEVIAAGAMGGVSLGGDGACMERGCNEKRSGEGVAASSGETNEELRARALSSLSESVPPSAPIPQAAPRPPMATGRAKAPAPVVVAVAGRGGMGKTVTIASLAVLAAKWGLRAAVVDLDLMFGNAHALLGVGEPRDMGALMQEGPDVAGFDELVESTAMKVAPGLTIWGPLREPERAELASPACERLIEGLRSIADIVLVDTSTFWSDAVALAVSRCDRCLVVGGPGGDAGRSAARVVELVSKMGVSRAGMTSVFTRLGAHGCGEDCALRFEMGASLRSKVRLHDGSDEVAAVASYAHLSSILEGQGAFAESVRGFARKLFKELGCVFDDPAELECGEAPEDRPRIKLPWKQKCGELA